MKKNVRKRELTEDQKALNIALRKHLFQAVLERLASGLLCEVEDLLEHGAEAVFEGKIDSLSRLLETYATKYLAEGMGLPVELSPYAKTTVFPRRRPLGERIQ